MPLKRDQTTAVQVGFLVLLVLSSAQVAWWITDNRAYSRQVEARLETLYEDSAGAIAAALSGSSREEVYHRAVYLDPAAAVVRVKPEVLKALEDGTASRVNRYYWEGGFFLFVLISGMTILTSAIRHDAELRRRQQNFLAAISHEFKSPLASIRLAAETLSLRSADTETQVRSERIISDSERLLKMVNNLLDTARLEEGKHKTPAERVSLSSVLQSVIDEAAERAAKSGLTIQADIQTATVFIDPETLETILRNLLDNAVKACIAGKGTAIRVSAVSNGDTLRLSVTDDGIGFPSGEAAMLFEKFYRSGDELQRATPGTGLGLYIVKKLAALSGGEVHAESEGPGHGATVTVSWPNRQVT